MESTNPVNPFYNPSAKNPVVLSDAKWKQVLTPDVYHIAREKGTEEPFSSRFENFNETGTYYCASCGNPLFRSDTKFESGCGWPSFYEPVGRGAVLYTPDHAYGMERTEVQCGRCKAHLGHVFDDGPEPTGLRYCINGVVLNFEEAAEAAKQYDKNTGQDYPDAG
ncbi:peptide-methionine (R)-S-oxide reductase MsrB [Segetibacter sp. 3557_3]|uniref:peptide-methionine (R)-S-oxide reductase MsrB n=1 Tax=Segetibacter sp. 3557_3 TaxID=2547429 RepID=UPI001A9E8BE5|nr:peptide-methionine (R)-S-oxide reductase MsrB [Segetibacter sp. 3557_3]